MKREVLVKQDRNSKKQHQIAGRLLVYSSERESLPITSATLPIKVDRCLEQYTKGVFLILYNPDQYTHRVYINLTLSSYYQANL